MAYRFSSSILREESLKYHLPVTYLCMVHTNDILKKHTGIVGR